MIEHPTAILAAYWLAVFIAAMYILAAVTSFCTGESPGTLARTAGTTLLVAGVVFLVYDASGYLFALMMQDPTVGVRMPPNYSYWHWLNEPLTVKWHVLSFVPMIRFLPVLFALIAGGMIQIFLWDVTFHLGFLIFIAQVVLNLLAMIVLSFAFNIGISLYAKYAGPVTHQRPHERHAESQPPEPEPKHLDHLRQRVEELPPERGPVWRRLAAGWQSINKSLEPMYTALEPATRLLPEPEQDFLNAGGWLLVPPALLGLWRLLRRNRHRHKNRGRRKVPRAQVEPRVRLANVADALTGLGPRQLTVNGVPGRLRLVVMAGEGGLPAGTHTKLLDDILPGLGSVAANDSPRVEVWTDTSARNNFRGAFANGIEFPEPAGTASRWRLLAGDVAGPSGPLHLGLAVLGIEPTETRVTDVPAGQWASVLGLRDVPKSEQNW